MDYHDIDYMIKERRRDDLEVCERMRLLKSAAYTQSGFIHTIHNWIVANVCRLRKQDLIKRVVSPPQPGIKLLFG